MNAQQPVLEEVMGFYASLPQTPARDRMLATLAHYECPQDQWELRQMLELIRGKTSLIEIGSSFGGTLKRMAEVLAPRSQVVSVDAPFDDTPKDMHVKTLKANCDKINRVLGHRVELFIGDSHNAALVEKVRGFAPFDFGFIDGDHSYEGVKADWENYGPMCKVVGFHDIAGPVEGCVRLWGEVKARGLRTREIINPGAGFGIGIVFMEQRPLPL